MTIQVDMHVSEGRARIALNGRFDFNSHRSFRNVCTEALQQKDVRMVEVDLGGVGYMDSSALGMLLLLKEKADAVRMGVSLTNCRGAVQQMLTVANFDKLFPVST